MNHIIKFCFFCKSFYTNAFLICSLFANSLWDLSTHFREDSQVLAALNKLIHSLQEMNKFHTILLDQASRTILKNLTSFIKKYKFISSYQDKYLLFYIYSNFSDIKHVRDSKLHFEKISIENDNVLIRNSQTPRSKQHEVEEVQNLLVATQSCFRHQALDYVSSIWLLQAKKRHEVLDTVSFKFLLVFFFFIGFVCIFILAFVIHACLFDILSSRI